MPNASQHACTSGRTSGSTSSRRTAVLPSSCTPPALAMAAIFSMLEATRLGACRMRCVMSMCCGRNRSLARLAPAHQIAENEPWIPQHQEQAEGDGKELPLLGKQIAHNGFESKAHGAHQDVEHQYLEQAREKGFVRLTAPVAPAGIGEQRDRNADDSQQLDREQGDRCRVGRHEESTRKERVSTIS